MNRVDDVIVVRIWIEKFGFLTKQINGQLTIRKHDEQNVILEWVSSRKADIIADQLGFLFSQITPDAECDIFNGKDSMRKLMFIVE